jgi:hypothetical protein
MSKTKEFITPGKAGSVYFNIPLVLLCPIVTRDSGEVSLGGCYAYRICTIMDES